MPADVPRLGAIEINLKILGVAGVAAIVTGVIFSVAPVLLMSHVQVTNSLRDGGHGATGGVRGRRIRASLMVLQVALAVILVVGAGLFLASVRRLSAIDLGFDQHNLMVVSIQPRQTMSASAQASLDGSDVASRLQAVVDRLHAEGSIDAVAGSDGALPLSGAIAIQDLDDDLDNGWPSIIWIDFGQVTSGYFSAMGIPLVKGQFWLPTAWAASP